MSRAVYEDDVIKLLNRGWKSGVYPLACDVRALPPAQPEREKGEWIDGFMCSVCRKGYRSQPTIRGVPMFKYCPECGADMR